MAQRLDAECATLTKEKEAAASEAAASALAARTALEGQADARQAEETAKEQAADVARQLEVATAQAVAAQAEGAEVRTELERAREEVKALAQRLDAECAMLAEERAASERRARIAEAEAETQRSEELHRVEEQLREAESRRQREVEARDEEVRKLRAELMDATAKAGLLASEAQDAAAAVAEGAAEASSRLVEEATSARAEAERMVEALTASLRAAEARLDAREIECQAQEATLHADLRRSCEQLEEAKFALEAQEEEMRTLRAALLTAKVEKSSMLPVGVPLDEAHDHNVRDAKNESGSPRPILLARKESQARLEAVDALATAAAAEEDKAREEASIEAERAQGVALAAAEAAAREQAAAEAALRTEHAAKTARDDAERVATELGTNMVAADALLRERRAQTAAKAAIEANQAAQAELAAAIDEAARTAKSEAQAQIGSLEARARAAEIRLDAALEEVESQLGAVETAEAAASAAKAELAQLASQVAAQIADAQERARADAAKEYAQRLSNQTTSAREALAATVRAAREEAKMEAGAALEATRAAHKATSTDSPVQAAETVKKAIQSENLTTDPVDAQAAAAEELATPRNEPSTQEGIQTPPDYLRSVVLSFIGKLCSRSSTDERVAIEMGKLLKAVLELGDDDSIKLDASLTSLARTRNETWLEKARSSASPSLLASSSPSPNLLPAERSLQFRTSSMMDLLGDGVLSWPQPPRTDSNSSLVSSSSLLGEFARRTSSATHLPQLTRVASDGRIVASPVMEEKAPGPPAPSHPSPLVNAVEGLTLPPSLERARESASSFLAALPLPSQPQALVEWGERFSQQLTSATSSWPSAASHAYQLASTLSPPPSNEATPNPSPTKGRPARWNVGEIDHQQEER